jgi:hypothetical protein
MALALAIGGTPCLYGNGLADLDMAKQSIIATRANQKGFQTWLAVDPDDVIHEITQAPGDKKGPVLAANLGVRITQSGNLQLSSVLPADKAAVAARRVSLPDGSRIHVILAWGFMSDVPETLTPNCHLYFFQENKGQFRQVASESVGERLIQFFVEDLHRDGDFEVLVTTQNYGFQAMSVWQIRMNGAVKKVQVIDGEVVSTMVDRFMNDDLGVRSETRAEKCPARQVCFVVTQYRWSPEKNKFIELTR